MLVMAFGTSQASGLAEVAAIPLPGARDVEIVDSLAFVASSDGLSVFNVSDPTKPLHLSTLSLPGTAISVEIHGGLAYVGAWEAGVRIIDVSNPLELLEVSSLETVTAGDVEIVEDESFGTRLVVARRSLPMSDVIDKGFSVVDVSDPLRPVEVGRLGSSWNVYLEIEGTRTYVLDPGYLTWSIDLATWNPGEIVSSYSNGVYGEDCYLWRDEEFYELPAWDLDIADGKLYLARRRGFHVFSAGETGEWEQVGCLGDREFHAVRVMGDHAFTLTSKYRASEFTAIDISDPENPRSVAMLAVSEHRLGSADLEIAGDFAYLTDWRFGVKVIDISEVKPKWDLGYIEPAFDAYYDWITAAGDIALTGHDLQILDMSNPTRPTPISKIDDIHPSAAVVIDDVALLDERGDLIVVDISNPHDPRELKRVPDVASPHMSLDADLLFASVGSKVVVTDVSDSRNPRKLGSFEFSSVDYDMQVVDGMGYFALGDDGLQILDLGDPLAPATLGRVLLPGFTGNLHVAGDFIYAASGTDVDSWLHVISTVEPEGPAILSSTEIDYGIAAIEAIGPFVYLSAPRIGIVVIDVTNPRTPRELGRRQIPGFVRDAAVRGRIAYLADYGLHTVHLGAMGAPACHDGEDNDHDGLVDFDDPHCNEWFPFLESPTCGLGIAPALILPLLLALRGMLSRRDYSWTILESVRPQ